MPKSRNARVAKHYLFSYGTLSPRPAAPEIEPTVRRFRHVGRGFVHGQLFDLGDDPGAILSRNGSRIAGQIFELPDDPEALNRLDEYEGLDRSDPKASLFVRKRRYVQLQNGREIFCWIYSYNRPGKSARRLDKDDKKTRSQSAS
jgi:gamma-glutamylcyclotransferase (GGCT)/AIG2-like uncharacterized protein YtfP